MATSGTYAFNPSLGELVLNALSRVGIRGNNILTTHLYDARMEANLLQAEWNNKQVNLWTVDLVSTALTAGTAEYDVADETVMILDAYINDGYTDTTMSPLSRTEYAAIPDKTIQGKPTQFWFDRLEDAILKLWPVPDSSATYTLNYYRCKLIQDAAMANGTTLQIPQLWLDAFAAGLAYRLSRIYAPQIRDALKLDYMEAWNVAATQNVENVALNITPGLGGYFR